MYKCMNMTAGVYSELNKGVQSEFNKELMMCNFNTTYYLPIVNSIVIFQPTCSICNLIFL